ncbi:uncharacterized protein LOC126209804 [Schistocerca nitens]|uniref:uncharacterized protein LOC126209804 n=1 Tax=Schistocerca nitens TaxID=7011 RepID=UPI00211954E3|nr:uncharacterized protein LOC126209804 [Schistocerca nitens]
MSFIKERADLLKRGSGAAQLKYKKTGGCATSEGDRYEERCLALLFLRGVREGLQFALSANDAAGGKFDDAVLCWSSNQSPGACTLLAQLKHKTSTKQTTVTKASLMSPKGNKKSGTDFSIDAYHESYGKIKNSLEAGSYALVLSTNIDLDEDARHMFVEHEAKSVPGLPLLEAGGSSYRLRADNEDVRSVVHDDEQFLKNFYFFFRQSNATTIESYIYEELKQLLGAGETSCIRMCGDLCRSVREWMNAESVCLTTDWKKWHNIVGAYVRNEVTTCNSVVTRIKYDCVGPLEAHIQRSNPAWIRPAGEEVSPLSATKVHQIICGETHVVVSTTRLRELEEKILCCWGPFCRWLVVVDDAEHSYDTLLRMEQLAGPERRLVIVSYKKDDSFLDSCKSGDISEESWKELIDVSVRLNSDQHSCCLGDLCDEESLKKILDGKPEAILSLSQLSGPLRMGQDLDPLPVNHIPRELTFRMRVKHEFLSSLGDREVCIMDEVSYKLLTKKSILKNIINFEDFDNYLRDSDPLWPLIAVTNNIDLSAIRMICSRYADIRVYVLNNLDDEWLYVEEQSRSVLQVLNSSNNRVIVEGKPGIGKSTMLLDMASQLKCQDPSWWILRIDLLNYSEVLDSCISGQKASKLILERVLYNERNLGVLERSLLQHCLLEYPRIICMADGFDEVCPDYGDKCLQALRELAPRHGKLLVTTRPSVTGRLEAALDVSAHTLPALSDDQVDEFHRGSSSDVVVTGVVRDLLKIPLFSKMYADSLESGAEVEDIVSLYEAFFERKLKRLHEEKWGDNLSIPGRRKKVKREWQEHEKLLGFLAVTHLLPRIEVPRREQQSTVDREDLVKAGVIYRFIDDKPVFIHRTFAEHFLAKWCFTDDAASQCGNVYRSALADSSLEFFVESFDRIASRGRPLLTAVINGSESEVKSLLEKGAEPMERDEMGRSSLHLVPAYTGDSSLLRLLVERLEVAAVTRDGGSASGAAEAAVSRGAAEAKSVAEVDEALRSVEPHRLATDSDSAEASGTPGAWGAGEETGAVGPLQYAKAAKAVSEAMGAEDGLLHWTPLRYAAEHRRWWAVPALLEMGAELRHLGDFQRGRYTPEELWRVFQKNGYRALFDYILGKNQSQIVKQTNENKRLLEIQVGVSIACVDMSVLQHTLIELKAERNRDAEVARLSAFKARDIFKKRLSDGSTAQKAELHQWREILPESTFDSIVQQLKRARDGRTLRGARGATMFSNAVVTGDAECVRLLIQAGVDLNVQFSSGRTATHEAAAAGHVDCLESLLSAGADVNVKDKSGLTPLHCAAATGRAQCVKLLLRAGADALAQDSKRKSPLHCAAYARAAECVRLLANSAKNLEVRDLKGATALHYAAENGDVESVEHLLRAGADSSPLSDTVGTPLHVAAKTGNVDCVRLLLQAGANLTAGTAGGLTALHLAPRGGNPDSVMHLLKADANIQEKADIGLTPLATAAESRRPTCVRVLVEEGADVDEMDREGRTPQHHAAGTGNAESVKLLLDAGADALAQDSLRRTPLHAASGEGNAKRVRLLVKKEADVDKRDSNGLTPLHHAASSGKTEIVKLLLDAGADALAQDSLSRTPLHAASGEGTAECVRLLVKKGADVDKRDSDGATPLHRAASSGKTEIVKLLLDAGADALAQDSLSRTPLHAASGEGNAECVRLLVKKGADVDKRDSDDATPLHRAASSGKTEIVKLLLDAGADALAKDSLSRTPLHAASGEGNAKCVRLLVKNEADVDKRDSNGLTPLHHAASSGKTEIVKLLLDAGADALAQDSLSRTPLHAASGEGNAECVRLLVKKGADVDKRDSDGATPLHRAACSGKTEIVKLLLDAGADALAQDSLSRTPLHAASGEGNAECVRLLVTKGADVDKRDSDGATPLYRAASCGKTEIVKLLLDTGADALAQDSLSRTPLHAASGEGNAKCVRLLVKKGADVDKRDSNGGTPLHYAAYSGQNEIVKLLLDAGADALAQDSLRRTPLHVASGEGNAKCVRLLVKKGADVDKRDSNGVTPLHFAAYSGKTEIVKLLLDAGADALAQDSLRRTPLHVASGEGNAKCVRLLVKKGAYVDKRDSNGVTPLHFAAYSGKTEIVKLLLDAGADALAQDSLSRTPLHAASGEGNAKCVRLLVKKGADVDKRDSDGLTPLHRAASSGKTEIVKLLLDAGADALAQDSLRRTPLHVASGEGNAKCVRLLVKKGADVDMRDSNGGTPLHYAAYNGETEIVKLLLDAGAYALNQDSLSRTPLHAASGEGNAECVRLLVKKGADVDKRDSNGVTPLHFAAYSGETEIVKLLLDAGADALAQDSLSRTPLHAASGEGNAECVRLLVKKGADVDKRDSDGATPLHRAASSGKTEIVKLLLDAGADALAQDSLSRTPLHAASGEGNADCVRLLVKKGADVDKRDSDGLTPLHYAASSGKNEIVKLLLDAGADALAQDSLSRTPLHAASGEGNADCVRLLAKKGCRQEGQRWPNTTTPCSIQWQD